MSRGRPYDFRHIRFSESSESGLPAYPVLGNSEGKRYKRRAEIVIPQPQMDTLGQART